MAVRNSRLVPVLLGQDYEHVMCRAEIVEEGDVVTVTMKAKGSSARDMAALMNSGEPMALSFVAIPVRPRKNHIKE